MRWCRSGWYHVDDIIGALRLGFGMQTLEKVHVNNSVAIISPQQSSLIAHLAELWSYRELILNFVIRDLTTRYKQTLLGMSWAIIQPVFMMVVFSVFFGKFMHTNAENSHYPIFAYSAILVWQYVSTSISRATNSLLGAGGMMKKVYFPKLSVPIASIVVPAVDLAIGFLLLIPMMVLFHVHLTTRFLLLPVYLCLMVGTALGVGFWTAALHVKYRDIFHVVPFALQLWLFASPVAYSSSVVPSHLKPLFDLNPLVGIIEGVRWCLLDTNLEIMQPSLLAAVISFAFISSGLWYFMKVENSLADYV